MRARPMNRARWSDNDRYFGPFTYAKAEGKHAYRHWAVLLSSGGDEDGCSLRFSGFSRTLIIALPSIIQPWRRKVYPGNAWDAATVARIGRDWYYDTYPRKFGFSISSSGDVGESTFLHVSYGARTHDSRTDMDWGYFLPWTVWRHVRHSLYGADGNFCVTIPEKGNWTDHRHLVAKCPTKTFKFLDYDGESLTAKTRIEEREWRHGSGWFRWLSWFGKPMIRRSLDIEFSGETGRRKGSWKGGTVGHSIEMLPGELHESAFRRYCSTEQMTFVEVAQQ